MRRWQLAGCTAALVGIVVALDWFSRAEIAAALGYLLPISFAAWGLGRLGAAVTGLLCASAWLLVDLSTGDDAAGIEAVNLVVLAVAFTLLGSLREQLDHERRLAHTDSLTAVHNRRAFWNAIAREAERCRRHGTVFSLAYIDVDGFKGVNDRFGHSAGDELLRRIALELRRERRQLDMVARLGGDEFVVLLPGTGVLGAGRVVTRLQRRLQKAAWRQAFDIDFSIGCLTVLEAPAETEAIVARADELMYDVKRSGRGMLRHDVLPSPDLLGGPVLQPMPPRQRAGSPPSRLAT